MAELNVDGDRLVVHLKISERLEAFHDDVREPLVAVAAVEDLGDAEHDVHGLRVGTGIPASDAIGTFAPRDDTNYAVVHRNTPRGVRVRLEGVVERKRPPHCSVSRRPVVCGERRPRREW